MVTEGFSDDEVEAILSRALETQGDPTKPRLTLADVEDIGRQVGLNPDAVRRAAKELALDATPTVTAPGTTATADFQPAAATTSERTEYLRVARAKLLRNVTSYVAVNAFLIFVNLYVGGKLWFPWVLAGWGLGLAIKARKLLLPSDDEIASGAARSQRRAERKRHRRERKADFGKKREALIEAVVERIVARQAAPVRIADEPKRVALDADDVRDGAESHVESAEESSRQHTQPQGGVR